MRVFCKVFAHDFGLWPKLYTLGFLCFVTTVVSGFTKIYGFYDTWLPIIVDAIFADFSTSIADHPRGMKDDIHEELHDRA